MLSSAGVLGWQRCRRGRFQTPRGASLAFLSKWPVHMPVKTEEKMHINSLYNQQTQSVKVCVGNGNGSYLLHDARFSFAEGSVASEFVLDVFHLYPDATAGLLTGRLAIFIIIIVVVRLWGARHWRFHPRLFGWRWIQLVDQRVDGRELEGGIHGINDLWVLSEHVSSHVQLLHCYGRERNRGR